MPAHTALNPNQPSPCVHHIYDTNNGAHLEGPPLKVCSIQRCTYSASKISSKYDFQNFFETTAGEIRVKASLPNEDPHLYPHKVHILFSL